jgi:hypothetical protein
MSVVQQPLTEAAGVAIDLLGRRGPQSTGSSPSPWSSAGPADVPSIPGSREVVRVLENIDLVNKCVIPEGALS